MTGSGRRKTEALGEPYYAPPRTVFGRRVLPFLYSERLTLGLLAVGFILVIFGEIAGSGADHPVWAISGPGFALMVLGALRFT